MSKPLKIWMSNIGYARGLNGALKQHVLYAHRHLYCSRRVQDKVMRELEALIAQEAPDICCLVEVERGATARGAFSRLHRILDRHYSFSDIANKYAEGSMLSLLPVASGKCNAFFANAPLRFERRYLRAGVKRLVYKVSINPHLTLFFCHFSLRLPVRQQQFHELRELVDQTPGQHIIMGDFNIFNGMQELSPLLDGGGLILLNDPHHTTFRFHRKRQLLDVCLCSASLKPRAALRIIDQPYSDHDALVIEIHTCRT